jgi:hydroxyacylglutathione hydrolase
MTVNSYLVWDSRSADGGGVRHGLGLRGMLDLIRSERLKLQMIFLTHTHDDHVADLPRLAQETGRRGLGQRPGAGGLPRGRTFKENAHFHLGPLAIKTLSTWGHSPGQTTFYVTGLSYPLAVVGDSLFAARSGGSVAHFADQHKNDVEKILRLPRRTPCSPAGTGRSPRWPRRSATIPSSPPKAHPVGNFRTRLQPGAAKSSNAYHQDEAQNDVCPGPRLSR